MKFSELIDLINTYQSLERLKEQMTDNILGYNNDYTSFSKEDLRIVIEKIEKMREMEIIFGIIDHNSGQQCKNYDSSIKVLTESDIINALKEVLKENSFFDSLNGKK